MTKGKLWIVAAIVIAVVIVVAAAAGSGSSGPTSTSTAAAGSTSSAATPSSTQSSTEPSSAPPGTQPPSTEPAGVPDSTATTIPSTTTSGPPTTFISAGTLQVHYIDVGQGDSILILSPEGKVMLIDGGESGSGALAYLRDKGIDHVDVMVATHPHADHIGGLVDVLRALPVAKVITSGVPSTTATYEHFLDGIASAKAAYVEAMRGDTITLGSLSFSVLNPVVASGDDINETSLVLRLVYGTTSFLFTGDAGKVSEASMLAHGDDISAQVLKVGHHGSSGSCSAAFLDAVRPQVAVYSCGVDNPYGHPADATIANLEETGATICGTDVNGTVVVTSDGASYTTAYEKGSPRGPPGSPTATTAAPASTSTAAGDASGPLVLSLLDLTSPASRGSMASLEVKTTPGAYCTITVYYKSGPSKASGLGPQTAGSSGTVEWSWRVGTNTTPGTWKIVVTAEAGGTTKTLQLSFKVV